MKMNFLVGLLLLLSQALFAQIVPKKLLIYYSYPSSLNYPTNGYNLTNVANDLAQYDYVVLGGDLELSTHPDHTNTQTIITNSITNNTKFFGYIDLGVTNGTKNYSIAEIQTRINNWKVMGADGIFLDDFGYDYGVSRVRQSAAVQYAHSQNIPVMANAWNPDDAFGSQVNTNYNPSGTATQIQTSDFYLSESFLIQEGAFSNPTAWVAKASKLKSYQQQIGFKTVSITTNSLANANGYSEQQFFYAWYGAFIYGHEATGWGEYNFAANDPNNAISPFRNRPIISTPRTFFRASEQLTGNQLSRYTNTGQLWLDASTHTYGFISCTTCQTLKSGSWQDVSVWDCGHIPLACDNVVIKTGHIITLTGIANAQKVTVQGKLQPDLYKLRFGIF